jgi:RNA polymerase sigma-70 factor (ECF subfamily)
MTLQHTDGYRPHNFQGVEVPRADLSDASDDATLVRAIAAGDNRALEALYDRHGTMIFRVAMRILKNRELAEEVVQEVFWRVWRRSDSFESQRGRVTQWLFGITHNLCIDELRRMRSRPNPIYEQVDNPLIRQLADQHTDVPASAWASEQRRLLSEVLGGLPSAQREAVELMYFAGLTHQEIATKLDRPLGTVKTRVRLGLQKLNYLLAARGFQPQDAW